MWCWQILTIGRVGFADERMEDNMCKDFWLNIKFPI